MEIGRRSAAPRDPLTTPPWIAGMVRATCTLNQRTSSWVPDTLGQHPGSIEDLEGPPQKFGIDPREFGRELAAGEQSAVPADHLVVAIGQDRNVEPESLDAVGDLPDLLFAVEPRVCGVQLQFFDRPVDHVQKLGSRWFGAES